MRFKAMMTFLLASGILLLSYSNCGKMQSSSDQISGVRDLSSTTPVVNPPVVDPPVTIDGVTDTNCMNNTAYDACLFWKNPVAQRNAPYPQFLVKGTDLHADQTYGVTLINRITPNTLASKTISVTASAGTTPSLVSGKLRYEYKNELYLNAGKYLNRAWTAQLMAYYWITRMETERIQHVGNFYAADKNITAKTKISVDAYATSGDNTRGNASFNKAQNKLTMGYTIDSLGKEAHEAALSSEVYIHEMGHANLHSATSSDLYLDFKTRCVFIASSDKSTLAQLEATAGTKVEIRDCNVMYKFEQPPMKICPNMYGCPGAINEGQADFHAFMMFPTTPAIGETWENNLMGMGFDGNISRDPTLTKNITASAIYTNKGYIMLKGKVGETIVHGEIHDLGAFYASILYEIYTHPDMKKNHFEKIFNEHLKMITVTSDFKSALGDLRTLAGGMKSQFDNVDYTNIITTAFNRRGIQYP